MTRSSMFSMMCSAPEPAGVEGDLDPRLPDVVGLLMHRMKALALGCGSGGNALFLAKRGFQTTAVDGSAECIHRLRQEAQAEGLALQAIAHDPLSYSLRGSYDVVLLSERRLDAPADEWNGRGSGSPERGLFPHAHEAPSRGPAASDLAGYPVGGSGATDAGAGRRAGGHGYRSATGMPERGIIRRIQSHTRRGGFNLISLVITLPDAADRPRSIRLRAAVEEALFEPFRDWRVLVQQSYVAAPPREDLAPAVLIGRVVAQRP